ncbi:MAG TPA: hypothetical protein PLX89_22915 [Verrucomicrobiota bacterium]|nr:hypothetical protein [Verrucomicrobiales bacterium]HRI15859.1 hypothetical protein [Verrucomicrobiota bacterium]
MMATSKTSPGSSTLTFLARRGGALAAATLASGLGMFCGTHLQAQQPNEGEVPTEPVLPSRVNLLLNFEFADAYLTPRGMIVQDDGLTFQPLVLGLVNVYKSKSWLNDVTLVGGVWNDFASEPVSKQPPFGSEPKTHWVEIDPIAGVSFTFLNQLKLDVTYTAFNMQILNIGTSQHLETKLGLDDSPWLKQFALHPYFLFWKELTGKATAADVPYNVFLGEPGPGSSYYFEFGVTPGYTFDKWGLRIEAPFRLMLPNSDFYGEYYAPSSTLGLYEIGLKATIPLKFIAKGYGNWNFHAGFRYQNFVDENLQGMQQFNAPGHAVSNITQAYGGIGIFF